MGVERMWVGGLLLSLFSLGLGQLVTAADQPIAKPNVPPALSPTEAFSKFEVPGDLVLSPVLTEPVVRQPVFLNFDERGRMWVVQ